MIGGIKKLIRDSRIANPALNSNSLKIDKFKSFEKKNVSSFLPNHLYAYVKSKNLFKQYLFVCNYFDFVSHTLHAVCTNFLRSGLKKDLGVENSRRNLVKSSSKHKSSLLNANYLLLGVIIIILLAIIFQPTNHR